jgi:hypothetical protein
VAKMVQIRNVPDAVHAELKVRATRAGMSLSEFLLRELEVIVARPAPEDLLARVRTRRGGVGVSEIVRAVEGGRRGR